MRIASLDPEHNKYLIEYLKKYGEQEVPNVKQLPAPYRNDHDGFFKHLLETGKRLEDYKFPKDWNW